MKKTLTTTLGSLAVIAALALTGCTSDNPGPGDNTASTKAPIPTVVTPPVKIAPTSKNGSIESAKAAYTEYLDTFMAVGSAGGKDEEPLRAVSLSLIDGGHASAAFDSLKEANSHFDGTLSFKVISSTVDTFKPINGDTQVPLGQVDMSICLNKDNFHVVSAKGISGAKVGPQQMLYSVRAVWYGSRWMINRDWITDNKVTPCDAS